MRLRSNSIVAGRPAKEVRALLRMYSGREMSIARLAQDSGLDDEGAVELVQALVEEELVEAATERRAMSFAPARDSEREQRLAERLDWPATEWGPGAMRLTVKGHAVANASFAQPVKRSTAQRHLDAFLERVDAMNADPESPIWVSSVWLFGSFADPEVDPVGDIDLVVETATRGRPNFYAALDAYNSLKGGSRVISMHPAQDLQFRDEHSVQLVDEPTDPLDTE